MKKNKTSFDDWFKDLPWDKVCELGTRLGVTLGFGDGSFCTVSNRKGGKAVDCECSGRNSIAYDFAENLSGASFRIRISEEDSEK